MNTNNMVILRGRLCADPAVFANANGSSKVRFSLACENNYKNADGTRGSQIIPVEAYTQDYATSPFTRIHKGDKISVSASLRMNNYTDKTGKAVYSTVVFVESIQFEESKTVTQARAAKNAQAPAVVPAK